MKSPLVRTSCAAMLLCAILAGCTSTPPASDKTKDATAGVTVGKPVQQSLRRVIEQPASVEPFEETPLVAHISGYVAKVPADLGKRVVGPKYDDKGVEKEPGEVLAELSVPEMEKELQQKQALVAQTKAEVNQATAALATAEAHSVTDKALVQEAEALRARAEANYQRWQSESKRVEALVASKVVDKQIGDETLNQYKGAEATRQEVEAKVKTAQAHVLESIAKRDKANADVDAATARVKVAEAETARVKALVDYRYIRAPYDGVVTRRNIHTGHYVQSNASGGASVLFVVARTDTLRIHADIPEADATYITDKLKGEIRVPILRDQAFPVEVTRTSWTLDVKSRTLRIEMDYANKDNKLRPGTYANVFFTVELPKQFVLPRTAIFTHSDQPCCYRVVEGKAVRTPLKVGARDGHFVEVLKMQTREATKTGDPAVWEAITGQEEIVLTNLGAVTEGKEVPIAQK